MSQATKFYLPIFKTGYPFGKLYTFVSETSTEAPTYKDTNGTLHANPIILDEKGETTLYINKDITYRYTLYDANDNLIWDENNIKQVNGDPGAPGGQKGPKGNPGKQGVQGISGGQGTVGFKGATGDKGAPYLTRIPVLSNQIIMIPPGIDSVYITGVAGGGSGASWSPYIFMMKLNSKVAPITSDPPVKIVSSGSITTSSTPVTWPHFRFQSLVFTPGSGFSGQGIYRRKIKLDKTKTNKIEIFIGGGGSPDTVTLNGGDGQNTQVYLNNEKIIDLIGGLGGRNYFPKTESDIPTVPTDGTPIRLNKGHKNGLVIMQQNGETQINTPAVGQSLYSWTTTYKQKSGTFFVNVQIQLSYYAPLITKTKTDATYTFYTSHNIEGLEGSPSVFGNYYTTYQPREDNLNVVTTSLYKTAIKAGTGRLGWGAGGDTFYNEAANQNYVGNYFLNGFFKGEPNSIVDFNADYIKGRIRNYMNTFILSDSYSSGVAEIPSLTDTGGIWKSVQNLSDFIDANPTTYQKFKNSGFYSTVRTAMSYNNPVSQGGLGVNGFVLLEYGSIVEHGAS